MTADSFTLSADRAKTGETAVHVCDDERKHTIFSCMGLSAFDKICAIIGEVIGTGLLVFIGCLSVCSFSDAGNPLLNIALAFGLAIMIGAQCMGHVSGGHFNPAVSVAAMIYRVIDIPLGAAYILAQLVGGALAYGLLKLVMTEDMQKGEDGVCVTKIHDELSTAQGFLVEFIATGILVWVVCGLWDPRNSKKGDSTPLRAGLTVAILVMVAGPFTGGSLNPARSFGPALWTGDWEDHWVYWVAPTLGGAVFSLIYKSVFWRSPSDLDE